MAFVKSLPYQLGHMQDPNDPVRAAAEDSANYLRTALLKVWNTARETASRMEDGHLVRYTGISALANEERKIGEHMAHDLLTARTGGAAAMQDQLQKVLGPIRKDLAVTFNFGTPDINTDQEAALNAARFVREIGNDTQQTLNAIAQQGVNGGWPPHQTANVIRDSIGLTMQQAAAVQNYRTLLENGKVEALTRALRDKRFDIRPEDLVQLTPEQIDARVEAYHQRYINYRATTISRYETLAAANGGAVNAISNSVRAGVIPATTRKMWLIAHDERTCPRCRSIVDMQPEGVPLDQPFHWSYNGKRGTIMYAPLHQNCRCTNTFRVMR